jgi:hypothetical protein
MSNRLASLALVLLVALGGPAAAQKAGGTLRLYHWDNPPSLLIHEKVTVSTLVPMMESDPDRRRHLVRDIDQRLQLDVVKPIIAHTRLATCWHNYVHGLTIPSNSIANGWRFEDVWVDR